MTIIAARRYAHGQPQGDIAIDGQPRQPLPAGTFEWVGIAEPTEQEMAIIGAQFCLHPLAIEDALSPHQMPKVEIYGQHLFLVARTAGFEQAELIEYGQTAMFLGPDFLISVRFGSSRAHMELRRRLEADAGRLSEGPDFVAHAVLDFIVDGYLPIMDKLDEAVLSIEERAIVAFPGPHTIRRIFHLRRQLRQFELIVSPTQAVCERLANQQLPSVDPTARIWFADVLDHIRHVLARASGLKDTLAGIVETASLLEQHRQGEMTRRLAAWAAILAVPTAIAGIYGMNFDYMPELRWEYGYFAVVGGIAAICVGLWFRFRKIGWL